MGWDGHFKKTESKFRLILIKNVWERKQFASERRGIPSIVRESHRDGLFLSDIRQWKSAFVCWSKRSYGGIVYPDLKIVQF